MKQCETLDADNSYHKQTMGNYDRSILLLLVCGKYLEWSEKGKSTAI